MSKKVKEAPSGYGKTTAVQDYLRDNLPEGPSLYWWNADEDAPGTSWSRLCRAFTNINPEAGKKLTSFSLPKLTTSWKIAEIITSMGCGVPSVLVLDDFQHLQKQLPRTLCRHSSPIQELTCIW
jgi:LuxR family maltose regulon positive regulatory protein